MTSRRRSVVLFSTVALVLAACGGGSDTIETEPAPAEAEPAPVDTEPAPVETEPAPVAAEAAPVETAAAPVETEPAPVETEPAPVVTEAAPVDTEPAGDDASCLIGSWQILAEDANAWYDEIEASLAVAGGPAPEFTIDGDLFLTLTPTDYEYSADFSLVLAVAGQEGTGVATGGATGTWEATDGVITTTLAMSDLNISVTVAGVTIDASDLGNDILNSVPINNAPFDCAGPTIGFQVTADDADRHPVKLTPA